MLTILATVVTAIFAVLGTAKLLALPAMRQLAARSGFTPTAYRGIGLAELAGAAGVVLGLEMPLLGALAGAGLLVLLAGAVVVHVRRQAGLREVAPAIVSAVLVVGYLLALAR